MTVNIAAAPDRPGLRTSYLLLCAFLLAGSAPAAVPSGGQTAAPTQPPAWNEMPLPAGVYRHNQTVHRTDTVDIPVQPNGGEIEYMVTMKQGDAAVYSWRALDLADGDRLTSEFHGHTDRAPGTTGTLMFYRKATGAVESGALVAPFDGIHGWYLKNDAARPIVVRLTISGFYEVIPNQIKKP